MSSETRKLSKEPSPPGPLAQYINKLLHTEPYSFIFHGIFWSTLLYFVFPIIGVIFLITSLSKTFLQYLFARKTKNVIDATKNNKELGVYITGCDTGFGKDLTFALVAKGYTVFPGCLTEAGMKQYEDIPRIIPVKVDVTNEEDSINAAASVLNWIKDPSAKTHRYLHAVVNNAGIGAPGLIDWSSMSAYEKVMDVNFYGTVRTTKAFLQIFKDQSSSDIYDRARIVNVASVAGLFAGSLGSSTYSGSKHAVEAFSSCLRLELKAFGIDVSTVNPSSHSTTMVSDTEVMLKRVWNNLDPATKNEYGEEYFGELLKAVDKLKQLSWSPQYVEDALVSCIELKNPPPRVLVGMDAKYFIMILRILPMWVQVKILKVLSSKSLPACMK